MKISLWFTGAGAVVLAGAFLLGREGNAPGQSADPAEQQSEAAYVALDAQLIQTDENGHPAYSLNAARLAQQTTSGDITAQDLTLNYQLHDKDTATSETWTLRSREGQMAGSGSKIRLAGDVRVSGKPAGSPQPLQIRTQSLDFDTVSQDVTTKLPVNINWGGQRLTARGLTANLKQGNLRLESAVHGRISP